MSPALLEKITYAGTASRSFREASVTLQLLAELGVPEKQVERVTRRIGSERVEERDADVAAFQALPLVEKFAVPVGVTAPDVAVVMADGGRLQIREGLESTSAQPALKSSAEAALAEEANAGQQAQPAPESAAAAAADAAAADAAAADVWAEEESTGSKKGHWREDKVGLLLTMQSSVSDTDPCPAIPESFVDVLRIPKLVRELKKNVAGSQDAVADAPETDAPDEALEAEAKYEPPKVQQRQVVASRVRWPALRRCWQPQRGPWGSRERRGKRSWGMGRRITGRCSGVSLAPLCRFWISSMPCRMCLPRRWREGNSRRAGYVIRSGSGGCGKDR